MMPHYSTSHIDAETLDRYLAGVSNDLERKRVEWWLETNPHQRRTVDALRRTLAGGRRTARIDLDAHWRSFRRGVIAPDTENHLPVSVTMDEVTEPLAAAPSAPRPSWHRWNTVAITAVVFMACGLFFARAFTSAPCLGSACAAASVFTVYTAALGERANITLSDGTMVTLNVGSRLEIPDNFARDRIVYLTGQAYFHVAHAASSPFRVEANHTRTTVLGTEFGVRAYPSERVRVAVRSGRVQFNAAVLSSGDIGMTTSSQPSTGGTVDVRERQDVDVDLAFAAGRLVLNDVLLRDAIADLDRWYNVELRLDDPSLGDRLIGSAILENGSAGDLMDILRRTFAIRVVRTGRVLTLYSH